MSSLFKIISSSMHTCSISVGGKGMQKVACVAEVYCRINVDIFFVS